MSPVQNGIKGLSDRRRVPRLGKIHLGVRVANANGKGDHPVAVDYFVVPPALQEVLGEKPKTLNILFHSDDSAEFAGQNLRRYGSGTGLTCRGDGEWAEALVQPNVYAQWREATSGDPDALPPPELWARGGPPSQGGQAPQWREIRCYGPGYEDFPPCPAFASNHCKPVMQLQFVLMDAPGFGIWQLDTQSVMSIERVNSFVDFLRAATGGRIAGIPLTLSLEKTSVAPEGRRKDVQVLRLDFPGTFREALEYAQRPAGLAGLLPPPQPAEGEPDDDVEPLDGEVIESSIVESAPVEGTNTMNVPNEPSPPQARPNLLDEALRHGAVPVESRTIQQPEGAAPVPFLEEYPERRNGVARPPASLIHSGHLIQWAQYYFGWDRRALFEHLKIADANLRNSMVALEELADAHERNWNRVAEYIIELATTVPVE